MRRGGTRTKIRTPIYGLDKDKRVFCACLLTYDLSYLALAAGSEPRLVRVINLANSDIFFLRFKLDGERALLPLGNVCGEVRESGIVARGHAGSGEQPRVHGVETLTSVLVRGARPFDQSLSAFALVDGQVTLKHAHVLRTGAADKQPRVPRLSRAVSYTHLRAHETDSYL
eukprot:6176843-Pleurochrysis_carterae.AAC.4